MLACQTVNPSNPLGICLLKVKNKNTRTRCEIRFGVSIVNSEHIFTPYYCVSIVNFEHVIAGWEGQHTQATILCLVG